MVAVATVGHGGHTGGGDPNEYCPPLTTGSYVLVGPEIRDPAMKHSGYNSVKNMILPIASAAIDGN